MKRTRRLPRFLILLVLPLLCDGGVFLPSVLWHPQNPLFSCSDPVINVQLDDRITFVCPHSKFSSGQSTSSGSKYFENLFFLGTSKSRYDSCDASGLEPRFEFLHCDTPDVLDARSTYELHFRPTATSPTTITFAERTTYYVIGTGFRTLANLANTVGGSCNNTQYKDEYKLRLKIRVCSEGEVNSGACTVCRSEGCYYQACGMFCSNWTATGDVYRSASNVCSQLMKRSCTNQLLGTKAEEQSLVNASCAAVMECGNWSVIDAVYRSESSCYKFRERSCRNLIENNSYVEKMQELVPCRPVTEPIQAPKSDDSNTYKYIAIGATIACFLLGLVLGAVCHRSHHRRACPSRAQVEDDRPPSVIPYENRAYRRSRIDEDFVDGKAKPPFPVASMSNGILMHSPSVRSSVSGRSTDGPLPSYGAKLSVSP